MGLVHVLADSLPNQREAPSVDGRNNWRKELYLYSYNLSINSYLVYVASLDIMHNRPRSSMVTLYIEDLSTFDRIWSSSIEMTVQLPTYTFPSLGTKVLLSVENVDLDSNRIQVSLLPPYGDGEKVWYRIYL